MTTGRDRHVAATIIGSMSDVVLGRLLKADIADALSRARAEALEDAADRSQERVGINPLWLRDDARKIRQGKL